MGTKDRPFLSSDSSGSRSWCFDKLKIGIISGDMVFTTLVSTTDRTCGVFVVLLAGCTIVVPF